MSNVNFTPEMGDYKNIGNFKFWCQKTLPLVYDDSLSYYELLCKVVNYLNDLIYNDSVEQDNISNLLLAYNELQSYVNDYFTNLDVQNEINNKLDSMANDGSLSALIQPLFDTYKADIDNEVNTQNSKIDSELNAQNSKIAVLEGRMNTFASLPVGSTEGNAELIDIRVKADGSVADTAGNAVREQVSELKSDLDKVNTIIGSKEKVLSNFEDGQTQGYIDANGDFVSNSSWRTTDYLSCENAIYVLYTSQVQFSTTCGISFFDENKVFISRSLVGTKDLISYNNEKVVIPNNAKYFRATFYSGNNKLILGYYNIEKYKWVDKKWCCVGDSLTAARSRTDKFYYEYIADETGITTVNMGSSGTGYKRTEENGTAFYQRVVDVPSDSDIITIFGSFNDVGHYDLGDVRDTTTDTIFGCVNETIKRIYAINPLANIGIITPTPWIYQNEYSEFGSDEAYVSGLKRIAEINSIPCLDLYHYSGLRPWEESVRNACYTKDDGNGVHPDEKGHKIISTKIKAFLETIL